MSCLIPNVPFPMSSIRDLPTIPETGSPEGYRRRASLLRSGGCRATGQVPRSGPQSGRGPVGSVRRWPPCTKFSLQRLGGVTGSPDGAVVLSASARDRSPECWTTDAGPGITHGTFEILPDHTTVVGSAGTGTTSSDVHSASSTNISCARSRNVLPPASTQYNRL